MELKGNKGEWSELYVFLKLLADGRLYNGDGYLNKYDDRFYPILKIFRSDSADRLAYVVNAAKRMILVEGGERQSFEVCQDEMRRKAEAVLCAISRSKGSFDIPKIHPFLQRIGCNSVKAKSSDKADIRIVVHNLSTGSKPELGYSIKSKLGSSSTLINANKNGTNFIFRILGIDHSQANVFNRLDGTFESKLGYLKDVGAKVVFEGVASMVMHNNLLLLDLGMERILAVGLLTYYSSKKSAIEEITADLTESDPLGLCRQSNQPMYEYKIKQFLLAFALGMTSSKPWYGTFQANGGYIVVKEDGDIVCYHFFDRNDLENYLFYNTRFETPSTSRHEFGKIYEDDGHFYLKLNLQVRFK